MAGKGTERDEAHSWWSVPGPASGKETVIKRLFPWPLERTGVCMSSGAPFLCLCRAGGGSL